MSLFHLMILRIIFDQLLFSVIEIQRLNPFYWQTIDSELKNGVSPSYARRRKNLIDKL